MGIERAVNLYKDEHFDNKKQSSGVRIQSRTIEVNGEIVTETTSVYIEKSGLSKIIIKNTLKGGNKYAS